MINFLQLAATTGVTANGGFFSGFAALIKAASETELALAAFLSIAAAALCFHFFKGAPVWARLIAFIAMLIFSFFLSIRLIGGDPVPAALPSDEKRSLKLVKLISAFPANERMEKCLLAAEEALCSALVESVAGLQIAAAPQATQAEATKALKQGKLDDVTVQQITNTLPVSPDKVVTVGKAQGWNIDIFWCDGASADAKQAIANKAGSVVGSLSSLDGQGPIGRVRVRALSAASQKNPGYPNSGFQIRGEENEADAMAALGSVLNGAGLGARFEQRQVRFSTPRYVSVFVCSNPTIA